ncbi:MAG: hypothetical protein DRJ05_06405 [Bacteroidetes bacterium]|nr:MAG: hypothetical protein DRJ05_06405 [Bacteroidota bacterium]
MGFLVSSCGPKSVSTDKENLQAASVSWIPYQNYESVVFEYDTSTMTFSGLGREEYYENVRYMTDQSGFINYQTDYYANLERNTMSFESDYSTYKMNYYLERNKGDIGDWDILEVSMVEGDFYSNKLRIVLYETTSFDYGEVFQFKKSMNIAGKTFTDVYYRIQDRRPFEIYYTQQHGIVAFKLSSTELWTIVQ